VLLRNLSTFSSLSNPGFRLYFANNIVSQAGVNMLMMARSLLVYRLTGSAALLGIASVTNFLPLVVLSPLGGALADRLRKKYVVLAGGMSSVLMALLVAVPLSLGYLQGANHASWWILIGSFVLDGIAIGLTGPSYQAIVREIVRSEQVMNAVALNSLGMNILRVVAPLATGFIISSFGFAAVFYVAAGLFLAGNLFIVAIRPAPLETSVLPGHRRSWTDIKLGIAYVRGEPALMVVLIFLFAAVFLSMPYGMLMPVFADDVLKRGATGMGELLSASGVGAMLVSVVLASMPNRKRGAFLLAGTMLLGIALTAFSLSTAWYVSLVLIFFVGLGDTVRMTVGNTLLLYYSDHLYWGRVVSLQSMCFGISSLGVVLASLLAQELGVQRAIGGFAVVLMLVAVSAFILSPRLRGLD
jgi:MFS family permease